MDPERIIENAVENILRSIGEDPRRDGLIGTPERVAGMYRDIFSGIDQDPSKELFIDIEEGNYDLVVLRDIPLYSMCEHHLIPFLGSANICYLPSGRLVGASKIVRVLEVLTHRPQLQERLTAQTADVLFDGLQAEGVAVVIKAEQLCMSMRGVQKPGSIMVTSAVRGTFRRGSFARKEILSILGGCSK